MMLLDLNDWIKRILLVVGSLLIVGIIGTATWYNLNLKNQFVEGKTETNNLRNETSRLGATTDNLREELIDKTKELKQTLILTKEDTVVLNKEIKNVQDGTIVLNKEIKNVQEDNNKSKSELKSDIQKLLVMNSQLQELLKLKEQELKSQLAEREDRLQQEIVKLKDMIVSLNNFHKQHEREITELNLKIQKEIEWRNKYYFVR